MATKKIQVNAGDTYLSIAQREFNDPTKALDLKQQYGGGRLQGGSTFDYNMPDAPIANAPSVPNMALPPVGTPSLPPISTPPLEFGQNVATPNLNQAPPLSMSGQAPVYAPTTTANDPRNIGTPNIGKTMYQGGQQTFDIFDRLKSGQIQPNDTPVTPAEKEAFAMYGNYQKYQNADATTLFDAIKTGELTPDKSNLLWRALGQNGQPTDAMIQAYAMWQKGDQTGRKKDPFLGGDWQKITTAEDANKMINDFGDDDKAINGEVVGDKNSIVKEGTSEYDEYRNAVTMLMGIEGPAKSNYVEQLNGLRSKYGVQQDEANIQTLDDQIMAEENDLIARRNEQRSKPVAMGVIAGRVSEVERQANERINNLQRERAYSVNALATTQQTIGQIMKYSEMDYESAKEDYNVKFNKAMQAMEMFRSINQDEKKDKAMQASAELDQRKFEADQLQKRQDNAKSKLQVAYGAISGGDMDPSQMSQEDMIQWGTMEMEAGYPIGTFLNMANKYKGQDMKSQSDYYNADGERFIQFTMQDKRTGELTIVKKQVESDYRDIQAMDKDTLGLEKGQLDIKKAKQDIQMGNLDLVSKSLGITTQELGNKLKQAEVDNIPVEQMLQQMKYDRTMNDTYEQGDVLAPSSFINPKGSKYGMTTASDGSVKFTLPRDASGNYKTIAGRAQCGAFVNDALGLTGNNRVGDSIAQKKSLISSETPITGGAFVQELKGKYAENGHIGVVTKAYPDGSFDYTDANRSGKNDGTITTGHMTAEQAKNAGVVGFTNGYQVQKGYTNQVKNEESAGQKKETESKKMKQGIEQQFANNVGKDGKVSASVFRDLRTVWNNNNMGTTKEFDDLYKGYVNPKYFTEYGYSTTANSYWEDQNQVYNNSNKAEPSTMSKLYNYN